MKTVRSSTAAPEAAAPVPVSVGSYRMLSHAFTVATDLDGVAVALRRLLRPFASPPVEGVARYVLSQANGRRAPHPFSVTRDGEVLDRVSTLSLLLESLLWHLHDDALRGLDGHLAIHAAAASRDGSAIVLPGRPDAGKTTMVAGLTRAGFDYLTDEAALLDPRSGLVDPYPRPMAMDGSSVAALEGFEPLVPSDFRASRTQRYLVSPDDLRRGSVGVAAPPRFVVAPTFRRGAPTVLQPMSRATALVTLARNSFNLPAFGRGGLEVLVGVVTRTECYSLQVGDLDAAVRAVTDLFA